MVRKSPPSQTTIPNHKELDRGTLRSIIRQVGLTVDEFVRSYSRGFKTCYGESNALTSIHHASLYPTVTCRYFGYSLSPKPSRRSHREDRQSCHRHADAHRRAQRFDLHRERWTDRLCEGVW